MPKVSRLIIVFAVLLGCDDGSLTRSDGAADGMLFDARVDADAGRADAGQGDADAGRADAGQGDADGGMNALDGGDVGASDARASDAEPTADCTDGHVQACDECAGGMQVCENGRWTACQPPAEQCDGIDTDCDGSIDEGFDAIGAPCAVQAGACMATGLTRCNAAGDGVECLPIEQCDGTDNDCDGVVDNVPTLGDACAEGLGACAVHGQVVCGADAPVCQIEPVGPPVQPVPEVCDGVDNDCDGRFEEDIPGIDCYHGPANTAGVGACRNGQRTCIDGAFGACEGQVWPVAEVCGDGIDNDCNGIADDPRVCDPVCGNGRLESGEECDDHNRLPGDGCDAQCAFDLQPARAVVLICGGAVDAIAPLFEPMDDIELVRGCHPDRTTQALLVSGEVDVEPEWADYVHDGGRILTAPGNSAYIFNALFDADAELGEQHGACVSSINPVVRHTDDDPFWRAHAQLPRRPAGQAGCGFDLSGLAGITPLGGWSVDTVSLAQRRLGSGRLYLVESQWNAGGLDPVSRALMRFMVLSHIKPVKVRGVQQNVSEADLRARGWLQCHRDLYRDNDITLTFDIINACAGEEMMLACRRVGDPNFHLAAAGRTDVVTQLAEGPTDLNYDNGVGFYYDRFRSWGFVPEGASVRHGGCDASAEQGELRLCWRAHLSRLATGWRCGEHTNLNNDEWERVVFWRAGAEVCGNGLLNRETEACDDGNTVAGDGCDGLCRQEICGNGRLDAGEQCDDGGVEAGDGCNADCRFEVVEMPFASCREALVAGHIESGIYNILDSVNGGVRQAYCDMHTDDGGWTLVASTLNQTLNDQAALHYEDLLTLAPAEGHEGIWNGLAWLQPRDNNWDLRFACRAQPGPAEAPMTVDLSFYQTPWYHEFVMGTDAQSCFNETYAENVEVNPARRNNVSHQTLAAGAPWNRGFLEGEDRCEDTSDFAVDFTDGGIHGNDSDGTDWGEENHRGRCGRAGLDTGQWFIFARESGLIDGSLRLTNEGNWAGSGRLEIASNGEWGAICDSGWSNRGEGSVQGLLNAEIACRQMGFRGALEIERVAVAGAGPIRLTDVTCAGDELRLDQCPAQPVEDVNEGCNHRTEVHVQCVTLPGQCRIDAHCEPGDGCGPLRGCEPVCGNGILQDGEICDDGNLIEGDGCDANCQREIDPAALVAGVLRNVSVQEMQDAGWQECYRAPFSSQDNIQDILDGCRGDELMMACRVMGGAQLTVAAQGLFEEVTVDVGRGADAVHAHNGVNFYFNENWSWGFAPLGEAVNRLQCDAGRTRPEERMCWHTRDGALFDGWRCGAAMNTRPYERLLYRRNR